MTKKHRPEPTEDEVKKRLKEFGRKHREKYSVLPDDKDEPDSYAVDEGSIPSLQDARRSNENRWIKLN